jgi:dephospho-CoA kinase
VSDIPLLFEALDPTAFDVIVLVDAPDEIRRERLIRERGLLPDEADRLMAAQLPSGAKRARSHIVIDNTGSPEALRAAAHDAWRRLLDLAEPPA